MFNIIENRSPIIFLKFHAIIFEKDQDFKEYLTSCSYNNDILL